MKQAKKDVRPLLRTSSFGFTLIETVVTLLLNALVMLSFIPIMRYIPSKIEDTFTKEKIMIRSYDNLSCIEGRLYDKDNDLNLICFEMTSLIRVYVEEKVFYVKKLTGIHAH